MGLSCSRGDEDLPLWAAPLFSSSGEENLSVSQSVVPKIQLLGRVLSDLGHQCCSNLIIAKQKLTLIISLQKILHKPSWLDFYMTKLSKNNYVVHYARVHLLGDLTAEQCFLYCTTIDLSPSLDLIWAVDYNWYGMSSMKAIKHNHFLNSKHSL